MICAEQHASRLVVPGSQRTPATRWDSRRDQAAKALKKLAGPHLPGSLAQLEKATARANRDAVRSASRPRDTAASGASSNTAAEVNQSQQEESEHELVDVVNEDA